MKKVHHCMFVDKVSPLVHYVHMRKKVELPEVEPVKLHPVFGLRPGLIILISLLLGALLLFFVICVMPGLISSSGWIRFNLNTVNTAIYSDGKYIGSSEGSVYRLPSGDYTFDFFIDGAPAGSVDYHVKKRVFFTLFIHRTDEVSFQAENTTEIEKAVTETFTSDVAAWSEIIDYSDDYHFPPLFSSFATNAEALGFADVKDSLYYGALHITSKAMYDDYLSALSILSTSSTEYLSKQLKDLSAVLEAIYSENVQSSSAPAENASVKAKLSDGFYSYEEMTITMGEETSLSYPESNTAPITLSVGSFAIASHPVSEYEFALFTEAVPYWNKSNKAQLIEDGMVDDNYLEGISLSSSVMSGRPIRNISYYAAKAYCAWLSEATGKNIVLPSEAEWYTAALSASSKSYAKSLVAVDNDPTSPSFMMGQLWEMTETPYIPLMRIGDYSKAVELSGVYPYDDIIVKGGSYINTEESISRESVGCVDKSATSPYVGFRVAIR